MHKVLQTAQQHFSQVCEDLKSNSRPVTSGEGFNIEAFWNQLETNSKDIALLSTKATISFTKSATPSQTEAQDIVNGLQVGIETLITTFKTFPIEQGIHIRKKIYKAVFRIVKFMLSLVKTLANVSQKGTSECLNKAAVLWSACEDIEKMPKNNQQATISRLKEEERLLYDALEEIDMEVKSDLSNLYSLEEVDNTEIWNNQDRLMLPPCVGLVDTARTCVKKITNAVSKNGNCDTTEHIAQLDNLTQSVSELSPAIYNFISCIYPPVNKRSVQKAAVGVVNVIQIVLRQIKSCHFIKDDDQPWINILLKAVDHNNNKLQPLLYPDWVDTE